MRTREQINEDLVAAKALTNMTEATEMAIRLGARVPPLDPTRIRAEIVCRAQGHVVAGYYLDVGVNVLDLYKEHLRDFECDLETATPEQLAQAQQQYELDHRDAEDTRNKVEGAEYRKQYDPSLPAAFRALFRRDMKPIVSIKVLGDPGKLGPIPEIERPKAKVAPNEIATGAFASLDEQLATQRATVEEAKRARKAKD